MKVLIAAAAAAVLIALPASAQTATAPAAPAPPSQCGALPAPPSLPDGAAANRQAMDAGNTAYNAWLANYRTNLDCLRAEAQAALAISQARAAAYNAGADTLNTTNQSWSAEVAEFTARNGATASTSNRREHGASVTRPDHE